MDHDYIDGQSVPECYLLHSLDPDARHDFEAHMVDCEACRDRLLLAEMFHARNGAAPKSPVIVSVEETPALPLRARFIASLDPWQIFLILGIAAMVLVLIPTIFFL